MAAVTTQPQKIYFSPELIIEGIKKAEPSLIRLLK